MNEHLLSGAGGVFPDVAGDGAGWVVVYRELGGVLVLLWLDAAGTVLGGLTQRVSIGSPEDSTFPRISRWRGRTYVAYRAVRADEWQAVLRECSNAVLGPEQILGRCSGNNPIALGDGWCAWQNDIEHAVHGIALETGERAELRHETRPTGLARVEGMRVVFIDEARLEVPRMLNPVTSGDCTVGEGPTGGLAVRVGVARGFVMDGICMTPRCGANGSAFAAVAWGPGVRIVLFAAADLRPVAVEPLPALGRAAILAFFAFGPERATAALPGNARVLVTEALVVAGDRVLGQYVASEGAGQAQDLVNLEAAIRSARAARPGVPVIPYWTRGAQALRVPAGADIVGVEAYRMLDESLAGFEARLRAALARCAMALIVAQCYTSNANNHPDLAALVPVYLRIARECPNVLGFLPFSGVGRATGLQDHPEVRPLWDEVAAGIPGLPAKGDEFVEPFKITIPDGWGRSIERGKEYRTFVKIGNGIEIEFHKTAADCWQAAVFRDGVEQDRSSATSRHLEVKG